MGLQLLGIALVIVDIQRIRREFDLSLGTVLRQSLLHLPRSHDRRLVKIHNETLPIHSAAIAVRAQAFDVIDAASTGDRLRAVEDGLKDLCHTIDRLDTRINEQVGLLKTSISDEERHRTIGDEEAREKIKKSQTGGLHLSVMGAAALFYGIILSTMSREIAFCLAALRSLIATS